MNYCDTYYDNAMINPAHQYTNTCHFRHVTTKGCYYTTSEAKQGCSTNTLPCKASVYSHRVSKVYYSSIQIEKKEWMFLLDILQTISKTRWVLTVTRQWSNHFNDSIFATVALNVACNFLTKHISALWRAPSANGSSMAWQAQMI